MNRLTPLAALLAIGIAASVGAQSPINSVGAMQPSVGKLYVHEMAYYRQFSGGPDTLDRDVRQFSSLTQISYGLLANLALNFDVNVVYNDLQGSALSSGDSQFGFGDMPLTAKWRIWQEDLGPTDTLRFAVIGGVQVPGGTPTYLDSSEGGWNPLAGAVFSAVLGRHGFNASALWEFNTEGGPREPDTLRYDLSYLFRLAPEAYGAETSHAAWYFVTELNGMYQTNGDQQLLIGPGIMYEARSWTADLSVQLPLYQELEGLPKAEVFVGVGIRVLF